MSIVISSTEATELRKMAQDIYDEVANLGNEELISEYGKLAVRVCKKGCDLKSFFKKIWCETELLSRLEGCS